jgi:hypothetical protein
MFLWEDDMRTRQDISQPGVYELFPERLALLSSERRLQAR